MAIITRSITVPGFGVDVTSQTFWAQGDFAETLAGFGGFVSIGAPWGRVYQDGGARSCMFTHAAFGAGGFWGEGSGGWDGPGSGCPRLDAPVFDSDIFLRTGYGPGGLPSTPSNAVYTGYQVGWSGSILVGGSYSVQAWKSQWRLIAEALTDVQIRHETNVSATSDQLAYLYPELSSPMQLWPDESWSVSYETRFVNADLTATGSVVGIRTGTQDINDSWPLSGAYDFPLGRNGASDWVPYATVPGARQFISAIAIELDSILDPGYDPSGGTNNDSMSVVSLEYRAVITRTIRTKATPPLHQRQRTGGADDHAMHSGPGLSTRQGGKFARGKL